MRVRRRFLHPLWLLVSLPGYIGWRLLPSLGASPLGMALGATALAAACLIIPVSVSAQRLADRRTADRIAWIGLLAMGFCSTLFVATLLRDVGLLALHWLLPAQASAWRVPSARGALYGTLAACACGLLMARRPRLVEVLIPIARLPRALHGFSIAQITDVHVGATIKRGFVERIVRRVNELEADLIAVTGDLVDGSVAQLATHTAPFATLAARHGAYFVTGNHEYYSGEPEWTAELRRLGLTVLKNEHVVLEHDGATLVLAGVTDHGAHRFDESQRSDPAQALRGSPTDAGAKILLAHQPASAAAAAGAGYDLQLSGHTHGGQFLPWNFFVRYFQPFTAGLHRLEDLWVYVSCGTGYWGPPNRFGIPSEITHIRLIRA